MRANLCRRKSSVMLERKLSSTSPPADSGRSVSNTKCGPSVGNDLRLSLTNVSRPSSPSLSRNRHNNEFCKCCTVETGGGYCVEDEGLIVSSAHLLFEGSMLHLILLERNYSSLLEIDEFN